MSKWINNCITFIVITVAALFCTGVLTTNINSDVHLPTLIDKVTPSVVYIEATGLYNHLSGSGVIVDSHIVLTARHVVQDVWNIQIETADGNVYKAISWVEDEKNDCALIFIDPREEFEYIAEFADSNEIQLGDAVITIGSPFGIELFNTVTLGIISGLNRDIPYFGTCGLITSDAAINPGNSGGPVFDMAGHIVGIAVGTRYGADGFGIIVPANACKRLLEGRGK